jgi:uncharacterized protein YpbB
VKTYVRLIQSLEQNFWNKINHLYDARFLDEKLYTGERKYKREAVPTIVSSVTSDKKEKGGTYKDTLDLYKQGKKAEEIAGIRSLTIGTIKGHFAKWILTGDIDVHDVLPQETIRPLESFLRESREKNVSAVFRKFGDKYDGNDVRMVLNHVLMKSGK